MEPRKGHAQTLAAFEELWLQGKNYNLFIIGKQGGMLMIYVNVYVTIHS